MSGTNLTAVGTAALMTALLCAAPALGADVASEIATAASHAELAAGSGSVEMVHMHLHHTLNCLVGPGGAGFDATQLNPCKNSGNGAIPDTTDAAKKKALGAAVTEAETGLAANDLAGAQKRAATTATMLKAD